MEHLSKENTYPLSYFNQMGKILELEDFEDEVLNKINELANMVGAPSYKKTPIFNKHRNKRRKKISDEDWVAINNFKQTELKNNNNSFEGEMDNLRSLLNKLTKKQYDDVKMGILNFIDNLINNDSYTEDNKESVDKQLKIIGNMIFEIGSVNKFWANLYASLYSDIIKEYPMMKNILTTNFDDFMDIFENIESCSPEENYDKFCNLNKENEKRKGLSNFFIILVKNVLSVDKMVFVINKLFEMMKTYIQMDDKIAVMDEICENLFILITSGYKILSETDEWTYIMDKIEKYTLLKAKDFKSLSSKTIFKFMDLQEFIEDYSDEDE